MSNTPCYTSITMASLTANSQPSCKQSNLGLCLTAHDFLRDPEASKIEGHSLNLFSPCLSGLSPQKNMYNKVGP